MYLLSGFQRDVLAIVAGHGPLTGNDVKEQLEKKRGEDVNHSRLYPNLEDLAAMNLIHIRKDTGARYNLYGVMPTGDRELGHYVNWLTEQHEQSEMPVDLLEAYEDDGDEE